MRRIACVVIGVSVLAGVEAAAQGLPDRVAALEARLAALDERGGRVDVNVACGAGETIGAALTRHAAAQPLFIHVSGTCVENVSIFRDNLAIVGTAAGDGVRSPNDTTPAIRLFDGSVFLSHLLVEAANTGLAITQGGRIRGRHLVIRAGRTGALADGGHLLLEDSLIEPGSATAANPSSGVWSTGANVRLVQPTGRPRFGRDRRRS